MVEKVELRKAPSNFQTTFQPVKHLHASDRYLDTTQTDLNDRHDVTLRTDRDTTLEKIDPAQAYQSFSS